MLYRHYKGGIYMLLGWGKIEATGVDVAVYQAMSGESNTLWIRPAEEFKEKFTLITGDEERDLLARTALHPND